MRHIYLGEQILLQARILGIADVIETMSFHRPCRPVIRIGGALEEVFHNGSRLFGRDLVAGCKKLLYEKGFKFER